MPTPFRRNRSLRAVFYFRSGLAVALLITCASTYRFLLVLVKVTPLTISSLHSWLCERWRQVPGRSSRVDHGVPHSLLCWVVHNRFAPIIDRCPDMFRGRRYRGSQYPGVSIREE